MPFARLKLLLVCSLIASTALFAVGVAIERSHSETAETPSGEVTHPGETGAEGGSSEGTPGGESSSPTETATTTEHAHRDAVFLGINMESWLLVGVVVVISLGLALAIWLRPDKPLLAITGVFALVFAAFDVAEVVHQVSASQEGLVLIAAVVALLHLSTAGLAIAALRSPEAA
jgi:hypothetical protein